MLHPSGYSVYFTSSELTDATIAERQEMLGTVLDGMLRADGRAGTTAFCLAGDLTEIETPGHYSQVSFDSETSHGELRPSLTLSLVKNTQRLQGFLGAIKRWPAQEAVIDAGCGPFPILALAAAVYHPDAEVSALEINPQAADAASHLIELLGYNGRIEIIHTDIGTYQIDPGITAAVTETFNAGLQQEPGPKIVRLLHESGVPIITPSRAELRLNLLGNVFYQDVDLRHDTHADISFSEWAAPEVKGYTADVCASYFDDFGLVLPYDTDCISGGLNFDEKHTLKAAMSTAGNSGHLSYELGSYPFDPVVLPINASDNLVD